jgi:hypothetical protein
MPNRLAVEHMSIQQLWDRASVLIDRAHPLRNQGAQDLDVSLQQLQAVLQEIKLRGEQLSFMPEPSRTLQGEPS